MCFHGHNSAYNTLVGVVMNLVVVCAPSLIEAECLVGIVYFTILLSYIPVQVIKTFTEEWVVKKSRAKLTIFSQDRTGEATDHILALISVGSSLS